MFGVGPVAFYFVFVFFTLLWIAIPAGFIVVAYMLVREIRRLRESIDLLRESSRE